MTAPATPPAARPSVTVRVENIANSVFTKLLGTAVFVVFGYFDYREVIATPQSTARMAIFAGLAVFGVALACTQPVVNTAKSILVVVGPYIPMVGRRKDDPA